MSEGVSFTVNGQRVAVASAGAADRPLVFALRNDLGLTATRYGCGQEACGACVVAVDGAIRYACTAPLAAVAGASVLTAEGLADDPVGAALLGAFHATQAGQCGYCLSGIMVSAFVLLKADPAADRPAIRAALDPHLCRCGAHASILRAVETARDRLAGAAR